MINGTQDTGPTAALFASLNGTRDAAKSSAVDPQDRFLKLLVTQMRNQDPLNPLDNAQVTSQLAQISTVGGIDKLNATLKALGASMISSQAMQASTMIGRGVLVPGSGVNLVNGQAVGGLELSQPADSVRVTIQDAAGNTVRTLQLGGQDAGVLPFAWDGQTDAGAAAADGAYKFTAEAVLSGQKSTPVSLAFGMVNAVTPAAQGVTLEVGRLGSFDLSAVRQIT